MMDYLWAALAIAGLVGALWLLGHAGQWLSRLIGDPVVDRLIADQRQKRLEKQVFLKADEALRARAEHRRARAAEKQQQANAYASGGAVVATTERRSGEPDRRMPTYEAAPPEARRPH